MLQKLLFSRYLEEDEQILYIGHSHLMQFGKLALKPAFFFLLLPLIARLAFLISWTIVLPFLAIGVILTCYRFLNWYGDGWVLTSTNVLDVKWNGFFHQHCLRLNYADFSGVTYESNGLLANLLGFGDVEIQMMSGEKNLLVSAAKPAKLQKIILTIKNRLSLQDNRAEFETFRTAMHKMLSDYFDQGKEKAPAAEPATTAEIAVED